MSTNLSGTVEHLYRELANLGVHIDELKQWNPTEQQLADLLAGLIKLGVNPDAQRWNDGA